MMFGLAVAGLAAEQAPPPCSKAPSPAPARTSAEPVPRPPHPRRLRRPTEAERG
jgi:hypothetical protein